MSQLVKLLEDQDTVRKVAAILPRHMLAQKFVEIAKKTLFQNPDLQRCEPRSFMNCIMQAAQLGLEIGGPLGLSYIVARNNNQKKVTEAVFQTSYKGLLVLVRRSGQIKRISAEVVYQDDEFDYVMGTREEITHRSRTSDKDHKKITHAYAIAEFLNGGVQQTVMNRQEIDRIKSMAATDRVWREHYGEMAKKTVLKRLCKYLPQSIELAEALQDDHEEVAEKDGIVVPHNPRDILRLQAEAAEEENRARVEATNEAEWEIAWKALNKEWERATKEGKDPEKILGNKTLNMLSEEPVGSLEAYTEMLCQ